MSSSETNNRNIAVSMKKSVENLVISSQDAIGQSISQALTFSGVISQHATQIINENKSVSRSPSPSPALRNAEGSGTELADSDKSGETAPNTSLSPPSDAISLCSLVVDGSQGDYRKGVRVAEGRSKKKSWYASLYPTYKSKSDDFKRLFKDLPDDERLIVDYSCALQKEILAHGRLYASQNYLCFHASIFGWETSLSLRWKDVTAITKEKTALVIPNAILVCTDEEKNFLTSFSGRDKAYLMLFRIWQNALMDQPMSSQEIWQWVHTCYGEELGFNSDDEGYSRDIADDSTGNNPEELLDSSSAEVGAGEERRSASRQRDSASPPLLPPAHNGVGDVELEAADTLPTDMSDTSDSEPNTAVGAVAPKCMALEAHNGRLLMKQQYAFNIDQLFTMMFTNSKFNLELLAARGIRDYVQAQWQPQNGLKCRQVSYVMGLTTGPIGPKEVHVTETQVMNKCSKPGVLYSIDCTCENAGIPYADYFSVTVHYCLYRIAEDVTELQLYLTIQYKKQAWGVVRGFLEKNTASGLEEFSRILHSKLTSEASPPTATARHVRRRRRAHQTMGSGEGKSGTAPTALLVPRASVSAPPPSSSNFWLWAILVVLLAINALLYYQLVYVERHTYDLDDLQTRLSSLTDTQTSVWTRLLEEHRSRQTHELRAWRDELARAVTHLEQTEQALGKLLESIKPTLNKHKEEHNEL